MIDFGFGWLRIGAWALLAPLSAATLAGADDLIVVDVDSHALSATSAGALFSFDPAAPTTSDPSILAAADSGAPFTYLAGNAVSPVDASVLVSDWGYGGTQATIDRIDCATNALSIVATGAPFVEPFGVTVLGDGRLVVVDWEADPSGLGADDYGGVGHGALFLVDVRTCTTGCSVTLLSDGTLHPFGAAVRTAFEDPVAVQYDPVRGRLYVADLNSPPAVGLPTSIYAVDVATGAISLVAANAAWTVLIALGIEPDGTILAVDSALFVGGSSVWEVDPLNPDPGANARLLSDGAQYSYVEDVDVDSTGRIFLVDSGDYDATSGTFIVPPMLFAIDRSIANPSSNAVLINESVQLVTPISIATRQSCAVAPAQLAVSRTAARAIAPVRLLFVDGTCVSPPWSFCVQTFVPGPVDGLLLPGEGTQTTADSVRFYEHSDPIQTMKVRRAGVDLVFSSN